MEERESEETLKRTINGLQRKIKDAYLYDDFDAMRVLNSKLLQLTTKLENPKYVVAVKLYSERVSRILTQRHLYTSMITQISEIFRPPRKPSGILEDENLKLQILEEEFQNAFFDKKFRHCLDLMPEILEIAKKRNYPGKVSYYTELKAPFEAALKVVLTKPVVPRPRQQILPQRVPIPSLPEKMSQIEQFKKQVGEHESRLEFQKAKMIYLEMSRIAVEINDRLTILLCDQMIAQIGIWEEEIEKSDFSKVDIPPFRLINRARYDCLEAFSDKLAAQQKMENLIVLGVKNENVKIVTVTRARFKGKSPYNKNGDCFAIYIRRSLD